MGMSNISLMYGSCFEEILRTLDVVGLNEPQLCHCEDNVVYIWGNVTSVVNPVFHSVRSLFMVFHMLPFHLNPKSQKKPQPLLGFCQITIQQCCLYVYVCVICLAEHRTWVTVTFIRICELIWVKSCLCVYGTAINLCIFLHENVFSSSIIYISMSWCKPYEVLKSYALTPPNFPTSCHLSSRALHSKNSCFGANNQSFNSTHYDEDTKKYQVSLTSHRAVQTNGACPEAMRDVRDVEVSVGTTVMWHLCVPSK